MIYGIKYMIKVYDNKGVFSSVEVKSMKEALRAISDFLDNNGIQSYYFRLNQIDENKIWVDYGSHSHFFYLESVGNPISVFNIG